MSSMILLPQALKNFGLRVREVPGWQARGHDGEVPIVPFGGMWHDTGDTLGLRSVWDVNGDDVRPDVPQPRANLYFPRESSWDVYLVAAGRAYHAGRGSALVLSEVANGRISKSTQDAVVRGLLDDTSEGNSVLIGHEVEGVGGGQALSPLQAHVIPRVAAAECALFGWTPGHHVHHRQYTHRKVDMSWHGDLWGMTAQLLAGKADAVASTEELRALIDDRLQHFFVHLATGVPNSVSGDPRVAQLHTDIEEIKAKLDSLLLDQQ